MNGSVYFSVAMTVFVTRESARILLLDSFDGKDTEINRQFFAACILAP